MFQNLHFYYQTVITPHGGTLLKWTHLYSKIKAQNFGTCGGELQNFCHVAVHRATCTQSITLQFIVRRVPSLTLQFIVPRVPNLSHYCSTSHVYPVCHITVHRATCIQSCHITVHRSTCTQSHITVNRATCTQSVTLQLIVPRVPSLSHYS